MRPGTEQGVAFILDKPSEFKAIDKGLDYISHNGTSLSLTLRLIDLESHEAAMSVPGSTVTVYSKNQELAVYDNEKETVQVACEELLAVSGIDKVQLRMSGVRRTAKRILKNIVSL